MTTVTENFASVNAFKSEVFSIIKFAYHIHFSQIITVNICSINVAILCNHNLIDASNSKGLISWTPLEWTYFAKTFGMELFRKRRRKGLFCKRLERPYSKTNFRKSLNYRLFKCTQISLRKLVLE